MYRESPDPVQERTRAGVRPLSKPSETWHAFNKRLLSGQPVCYTRRIAIRLKNQAACSRCQRGRMIVDFSRRSPSRCGTLWSCPTGLTETT